MRVRNRSLLGVIFIALMIRFSPGPAWATECPPHHTWAGAAEGSDYGGDVAPVGDINGDGWEDLAIGSAEFGIDSTGRCDVYSGKDLTLLFSIVGEGNGDFFGSCVTGGDLNGDGYSDLVVSAGLYDAGVLIDAGRVYIFYGGLGPWPSERSATEAEATIDGELPYDGLGSSRSLAVIDDVDGDSCAELAIGAASFNVGIHPGRVYVFSGQTLDTLYTLAGENNRDVFGVSVRPGGDINGDGIADLIVGAPAWIYLGQEDGLGHVYIYSAANGQLIGHLMSGEIGDAFGWGLDGIGDVNQDGYDDLAVGAHHWPYDGSRHDTGRVYVFLGRDSFPDTTFTDSAIYQHQGEFDFANFGATIRGVGDINADGHDDFAVAAYSWWFPNPRIGWAYVYSGIDGTEMFRMTDGILRGRFGYSLASALDLNQDGARELWIGAFSANDSGQVYCYLIGDTDQDSLMAGCDNCPTDSNTNQADADTDGYGDVCDNCPAVCNADQGATITMTGDVNLNGSITSADIIYLVNFTFKGGPAPQPLQASGDVNCSGSVTSADIIFMVNHVFKGTNEPCDACTELGDNVFTCP